MQSEHGVFLCGSSAASQIKDRIDLIESGWLEILLKAHLYHDLYTNHNMHAAGLFVPCSVPSSTAADALHSDESDTLDWNLHGYQDGEANDVSLVDQQVYCASWSPTRSELFVRFGIGG